MRIAIREHLGRSHLLFDFHHACADGIGGLSFVEDILSSYAHRLGKNSRGKGVPPRIDLDALQRRESFAEDAIATRGLFAAITEVAEATAFLSIRPSPIAMRVDDAVSQGPVADTKRMAVYQFPPGFTAALRATAAQQGCSLNDLLLYALFLTLKRWNETNQDAATEQLLRILMPINLRNRVDMDMPALNRTGNGFLTRTSRELMPSRQLLNAIATETAMLRKSRYGVRWLRLLGRVHAVPMFLPWLLTLKRCWATAALSNLGDPTRRFRATFPRDRKHLVVGNVRLDGFCAITPTRPMTRAVFLANTYANRLTLAARLDPTCFRAGDTELMLAQYSEAISECVASKSTKTSAEV